jgi:hypothetical protein
MLKILVKKDKINSPENIGILTDIHLLSGELI